MKNKSSSFWQNIKRHSGRKCCRTKTETTLRHKHLAVLLITKNQMNHYVIIENLIINHIHMKNIDYAKKKKIEAHSRKAQNEKIQHKEQKNI